MNICEAGKEKLFCGALHGAYSRNILLEQRPSPAIRKLNPHYSESEGA